MTQDVTDDMGMLNNPIFGLGAFEVHEATVVSSRLALDAPADSADAMPLSVGKWAIPDHCMVCSTPHILHLGLLPNEASALGAHFLQAFGHVKKRALVLPISALRVGTCGVALSPLAVQSLLAYGQSRRRINEETRYQATHQPSNTARRR